MTTPETKKPSWLFAAATVLLFFVVVSQAMNWTALQLRDFEIPVDGGPHLTTADDWRSELNVLKTDIVAFWRETLTRDDIPYAPPTILDGMEGPRSVCGGSVVTEATVFCLRSSTIHLNRIRFNGISRASNAGKSHLAVAYAVARLMSRQTQILLGVDLAPKGSAEAEQRRRIELQARVLRGPLASPRDADIRPRQRPGPPRRHPGRDHQRARTDTHASANLEGGFSARAARTPHRVGAARFPFCGALFGVRPIALTAQKKAAPKGGFFVLVWATLKQILIRLNQPDQNCAKPSGLCEEEANSPEATAV